MTEYLIFVMLFSVLGLNVLIANTIAFSCGILTSFTLNRGWSFKKSAFLHAKTIQVILYTMLAIANLGLTSIALSMSKTFGIREEILKIMIMCAIVVWNFIIFNRIIFKQNPTI